MLCKIHFDQQSLKNKFSLAEIGRVFVCLIGNCSLPVSFFCYFVVEAVFSSLTYSAFILAFYSDAEWPQWRPKVLATETLSRNFTSTTSVCSPLYCRLSNSRKNCQDTKIIPAFSTVLKVRWLIFNLNQFKVVNISWKIRASVYGRVCSISAI